MSDNVLKATVDAIAESDNEIGGFLVTRTRQVHAWGSNDGELFTADSDRLTVKNDTFDATWVGLGIDILTKGTPTGNEGQYRVKTYVDAKNVDLETLAAGAPGFVDEDDVQWRTATLRVESTYEFLDPSTHVTDTEGKLWVGNEDELVTYGAIQVCEFQELGDYSTGEGYLTENLRTESEVVDGSRSWSAIDKLRRSFLVEYATEEELDRIGRNVAVIRHLGMSDTIYRCLLKTLSYLPKATIYGIELVLECLFPGGGYTNQDIPFPIPTDKWVIYEDLINFPNTIFILLPVMAPGQDEEGRGFLESLEDKTAASTTTVTVDHTPISIQSVKFQPVTQELDMSVLPSADSPAWTYQGQGAVPPAEGSVFSILSAPAETLQHVVSGAPSSNSGRYYRTVDELAQPDFLLEWEISIWWRANAVTTVNGYPWHIRVRDGEIAALLEWDDDDIRLDATVIAAGALTGVTGNWHRFKLYRKGLFVRAELDNVRLATVPVSDFGADANKDFSFGYINQASANQDWTVWWDGALIHVPGKRNYWNLYHEDGSFTTTSDDLTDSTNSPFVAGDVGRHVRTRSDTNNENQGLWLVTAQTATTLTLDGIERERATVHTVGGAPTQSFVTLEDPWFDQQDPDKKLVISGSALGNDGTVDVLEWISPFQVRVDATPIGSSGFASESLLTWKFDPNFVTESSIKYEVVDAGSVATKTLTVRNAWPSASQPVTVDYTAVNSMQLLRDAFVTNDGSGGSEPNIYYPFYLWDIDQATRDLMDDITAAGVIPEFERSF